MYSPTLSVCWLCLLFRWTMGLKVWELPWQPTVLISGRSYYTVSTAPAPLCYNCPHCWLCRRCEPWPHCLLNTFECWRLHVPVLFAKVTLCTAGCRQLCSHLFRCCAV
jgi:hypothetical protein